MATCCISSWQRVWEQEKRRSLSSSTKVGTTEREKRATIRHWELKRERERVAVVVAYEKEMSQHINPPLLWFQQHPAGQQSNSRLNTVWDGHSRLVVLAFFLLPVMCLICLSRLWRIKVYRINGTSAAICAAPVEWRERGKSSISPVLC